MARRKKPTGGALWRRKMPMSMRSQLRNDLVNTGRGPSVGALMEYKARTKSMMDGFEPVDRFINTPAGRVDMKRARLKQEGIAELQRSQHAEREYVKQAVDKVLELLGPDVNVEHCVVLRKTDKYVWRMYWTTEFAFILQHDTWARCVSKSDVYSNAIVAKELFVNRMVTYRTKIIYPDASG